jgi:molecular chaperone DnaK (HSP70)
MGVRPMFSQNKQIGQFALTLKNSRPKGVSQIVVTIEYFADYSFKVTAEDAETKVIQTAVFESGLGKPSKDTLDQILETAKKYKSQDEEVLKKLDLFRTYDGMLSQFESQYNMSKTNANLSEYDKSFFETILKGSKKWIEENRSNEEVSTVVIQAKIDDIKNAATELATKLQESAKKPEEAEQEKGKETL